jgi:ATP-dependent Zn protease
MSDRVQARLDRAYAEARTFIRKNIAIVLAVAELLARKRVLDKSEVDAIMTASGHKGEP